MKNINKVEWEKIRKQGLFIYLLVNWIIVTALPATVITTGLRWLIQDRSTDFFTSGAYLDKIITSFFLCFVLAISFGLRKWLKSEKAYESSDMGK